MVKQHKDLMGLEPTKHQQAGNVEHLPVRKIVFLAPHPRRCHLDGQQAPTDNRLDGMGHMIENQAANGEYFTLGCDDTNHLI